MKSFICINAAMGVPVTTGSQNMEFNPSKKQKKNPVSFYTDFLVKAGAIQLLTATNSSSLQHAPEIWGEAKGGEKTQNITDATIIVLLITAKFATCWLQLHCGLYELVWLEDKSFHKL